MNLHLCSFAPSAPTLVCAAEFGALWQELSYEWVSPWSGEVVRIFDIRHVASIPNGEQRLAHALMIAPAGGEHCVAGQAEPVVDTLPFTGMSLAGTALAGAGALLAGVVALRIAAADETRGRHRKD